MRCSSCCCRTPVAKKDAPDYRTVTKVADDDDDFDASDAVSDADDVLCQVIKEPMDLRTMRSRIDNDHYEVT
jgi:hypothetical protein